MTQGEEQQASAAAADDDVIDVTLDTDGKYSAAGDKASAKAVGAAAETAVAMPKPIIYGVCFHISAGGGSLGADGAGRLGRRGRRARGYLREGDVEDEMMQEALNESSYEMTVNEVKEFVKQAVAHDNGISVSVELLNRYRPLAFSCEVNSEKALVFKKDHRVSPYVPFDEIYETVCEANCRWRDITNFIFVDDQKTYGIRRVKTELDSETGTSLLVFEFAETTGTNKFGSFFDESKKEKQLDEATLTPQDQEDIADMFASYSGLGAGDRTRDAKIAGFMQTHAAELKELVRQYSAAGQLGDYALARDLGNDDMNEDDLLKGRKHNAHIDEEDVEDVGGDEDTLDEALVQRSNWLAKEIW